MIVTTREDLEHILKNLNMVSEIKFQIYVTKMDEETLYALRESGRTGRVKNIGLYLTASEMFVSLVMLVDYLDLAMTKRNELP